VLGGVVAGIGAMVAYNKSTLGRTPHGRQARQRRRARPSN
jgi:hypothetical protein